MTKMRFTDCDKWDDPWFMELAPAFKQLWNYLCDKCDNAGVWSVNGRLAEFHIGIAIDWPGALRAFGDRIQVLADGKKWRLVKFIAFQYPSGLGISNPHKQVIRLLESHGISLNDSKLKGSGSLQVGSMEPPRLDQTRPDSPSSLEGGAGGNLRVVESPPILRVVESPPKVIGPVDHIRSRGADLERFPDWPEKIAGRSIAVIDQIVPPDQRFPSLPSAFRKLADEWDQAQARHAAEQAEHKHALTEAIKRAESDESRRRAEAAAIESIEPLRAILGQLVVDPLLAARVMGAAPNLLGQIRTALDTGRGNVLTLGRARKILAEIRGAETKQTEGAQA